MSKLNSFLQGLEGVSKPLSKRERNKAKRQLVKLNRKIASAQKDLTKLQNQSHHELTGGDNLKGGWFKGEPGDDKPFDLKLQSRVQAQERQLEQLEVSREIILMRLFGGVISHVRNLAEHLAIEATEEQQVDAIFDQLIASNNKLRAVAAQEAASDDHIRGLLVLATQPNKGDRSKEIAGAESGIKSMGIRLKAVEAVLEADEAKLERVRRFVSTEQDRRRRLRESIHGAREELATLGDALPRTRAIDQLTKKAA